MFTYTQQLILRVLSDGKFHPKEELRLSWGDELADFTTLNMHITNIRKVLRLRGEDIVYSVGSGMKFGYRHVRLLPSAIDGTT